MKITNRSCHPLLLVTVALTRTITTLSLASSSSYHHHHQVNNVSKQRSAADVVVMADDHVENDNATTTVIILPDQSTLSLDDMLPRSYFAPSAKCFENDTPIPCPEPTIVTKTDARTGFTIIASSIPDKQQENISSRGGEGQRIQLSSIAVRDPTNGHRVPITIQSVASASSSIQKTNNFTNDNSNNHQNPKNHGDHGERHASTTLTETITSSVHKNVRRYLQKEKQQQQQPMEMEIGASSSSSTSGTSSSSCTSYREIELAIVVESSFCQAIGSSANDVDRVVNSIIANVASEYEMNALCFTIIITHYEKHFNASIDPYKAGVDLNVSGCNNNNINNNYGLLDYFEDFWNANRSHVHRDAAELFTGTPLECAPCNFGGGSSDSSSSSTQNCCTVGCSRPAKSCLNLENSYGVSWVTYSSSHVARSNLVAHEIAHTLGATHNSGSTDYLMHPANGGNDKYFCQTSIESLLNPRNDVCITHASGPQRDAPSKPSASSLSTSPVVVAPSAASSPISISAATVPGVKRLYNNNETTSVSDDFCGSGQLIVKASAASSSRAAADLLR